MYRRAAVAAEQIATEVAAVAGGRVLRLPLLPVCGRGRVLSGSTCRRRSSSSTTTTTTTTTTRRTSVRGRRFPLDVVEQDELGQTLGAHRCADRPEVWREERGVSTSRSREEQEQEQEQEQQQA